MAHFVIVARATSVARAMQAAVTRSRRFFLVFIFIFRFCFFSQGFCESFAPWAQAGVPA